MKKLLGLLLVTAGLLAGCAAPTPYAQNCINTTPSFSSARWTCMQGEYAQGNASIQKPVQTAAQIQTSQIQSRINAGNQASLDCTKANMAMPAGEIVSKDILILQESQANKFDLLTSKAKLSGAQKTAFKQFLSGNAACRISKVNGYAGTPYQSIQLRADSDKDLIYAKLLMGQYTVGEANVALKQVNVKYQDDLKTEAAAFNRDLQNQTNTELANRQQQTIVIQQQSTPQTPAYDWNATPTTNLTGGLGGGGKQIQLQGMPNQNRPPCVSRTVNGQVQSCQ